MRIGAHVSIAGGLTNAIKQASACGAECFQIFLRSPRGGKPAPLTTPEIADFKTALKKSGLGPVFVHASYLVNLASAKPQIIGYSVDSVRDDLERGSALGLEAVVVHTGSAVNLTHEQGLKNVVKNVRTILKGYKGATKLLLEISAGSGDCVGRTLDELSWFLKQIKNELDPVGYARRGIGASGEPRSVGSADNIAGSFIPRGKATGLSELQYKKLGVCLDTAHSFASGYDLASSVGIKKYAQQVKKLIGWDKVGLIHANDSKVALGKLVDRHEHLGKGHIGDKGLREFFGRPELKNKCAVIETPKDSENADKKNLAKLRDWVA